MVVSLKMRSNETAQNNSQADLRALLNKSPAAHRFRTLFGTSLEGFVGKINEVFEAPKAEGVDFDFPTGKRAAFLSLVDPSTAIGRQGPFAFQGKKTGKMVPDDPGVGHPDRVWRRLASAASAGISYREPGLGPSLHIAIRSDGANVHLDREGFVKSMNGRVIYDPKQTVNHLTADLASDFVPVLVTSLMVKDDSGKTSAQATFAPWLEVNLPGSEKMGGGRRSRVEGVAGFRLFGIFSAGGG